MREVLEFEYRSIYGLYAAFCEYIDIYNRGLTQESESGCIIIRDGNEFDFIAYDLGPGKFTKLHERHGLRRGVDGFDYIDLDREEDED